MSPFPRILSRAKSQELNTKSKASRLKKRDFIIVDLMVKATGYLREQWIRRRGRVRGYKPAKMAVTFNRKGFQLFNGKLPQIFYLRAIFRAV
jgi:hypothetical protein